MNDIAAILAGMQIAKVAGTRLWEQVAYGSSGRESTRPKSIGVCFHTVTEQVMTFEYWDPNERLNELRRRSDQMWQDLLANLPLSEVGDEPIAFHPEVDLVETQQDFRFYLSIPGLVEDDIVIDVQGQRLTIRGERRPPYDPNCRQAHMQEWRYGCFERHFELSTTISAETIRANYDAGVLTIVAQKMPPIEFRGTEDLA